MRKSRILPFRFGTAGPHTSLHFLNWKSNSHNHILICISKMDKKPNECEDADDCDSDSGSSDSNGELDCFDLSGHMFRFDRVKSINGLGLIDFDKYPKHGYYQMIVYKYDEKKVGKAKLVTGIDVLVSAPPSHGLDSTGRVIVYNMICNKDGRKNADQTVLYQKLVLDALMDAYNADIRVVSDNMLFDIGGQKKKGPKAGEYISKVFCLQVDYTGSVILQPGKW